MYWAWRTLDYSPRIEAWLYLADGLDPNTLGSPDTAGFDAAVRREASAFIAATPERFC